MDHHCPWLGGGCVVSLSLSLSFPLCKRKRKPTETDLRSIPDTDDRRQGWANYKFFLLALLYTGALGIFTAGIMFHELANYVSDIDDVRPSLRNFLSLGNEPRGD